jgi:ABC-type branched-subunit amino acid transport system substrate-binding protein
MGAPITDDEFSKYAPKQFREQPRMPAAQQLHVAPTVRSSTDMHQERPTTDEIDSWPERIPEPPPPRSNARTSSLFARFSPLFIFAAVLALAIIFYKPVLQAVGGLFEASQPSKPSDRPAADTAPLNGRADRLATNTPPAAASVARPAPALVPQPAQPAPLAQPAPASVAQPAHSSPAPAAAPLSPPPANAQTQVASAPQPLQQEAGSTRTLFRGVTDTEIRFGISAALSGPTKELGQNMKMGIMAAFNAANANGGIFGRQLRLIAADDGYEPARAAVTMKQLYENDKVFGVVGNVGTPTAVVALPYALERKMLFFGAFTGAGLLRNDPPDRYVFNYRASYAEETEATVHYLVKVRHLKTSQIAVFAQQDAYGDSGFAGVAKAIRSLGGNDRAILRLNYQRNTVDVDEAVAQLHAYNKSQIPIKAVIMVPTYRAAAKFIEKTRDLYPDMIYTSVSFVGSTALANELMLLGKRFAKGVIVTQVVPAVDGHSSLALEYKSALAKYFPGEAPDYVSFEGYVAANVLIAALKRNGAQLDTERLVATLENLRGLDIGLGTPVTFSPSEHQGVHKVWGTQLDDAGHYQPIDLQ